MHPFLRTCLDKIMSTDGGQTDRQTDRLNPIYSPPQKKTSFVGGINIVNVFLLFLN